MIIPLAMAVWRTLNPEGTEVRLKKFTGDFSDVIRGKREGETESDLRRGIVLDLETTGFNRDREEVIEIGMRPFVFHRLLGEVRSVGEGTDWLHDPGFPLSPEIERLTGLTSKDLAGHELNWTKVDEVLTQSDLVIAHNASFDRPFVDKRSRVSPKKVWGCSLKQVDWASKGFPAAKLEMLSAYHGFFTNAHRALADADAVLYLLAQTDPATRRSYLAELLEAARVPSARVFAVHAPYDKKEDLKGRGYRWDPQKSVWNRTITKTTLDEEKAWLEACVYRGAFRGHVVELSLEDQFKAS